MKETTIEALKKEDVIDLISKQWMLVTAGTRDSYNTMTFSQARLTLQCRKLFKSQMQEAAFFDADLTEADFGDSDLFRAGFQGANLTRTDLSAAQNWSIRPDSCLLSRTVFSEDNLRGLVEHLNIIIK